MDPDVPVEPLGSHLENGRGEQLITVQIGRCGQIVLHPSLGRLMRDGRLTHVDDGQEDIGAGSYDLLRSRPVHDEAEPKRIDLRNHFPQRRLEQIQVQ
ncbi:hypothetical protein GCM10012280_56620 [Wenjunlia tyrosinilytica]|uniref:Uncharacterized protein n=1 Tax=Wenjunlia tyrosinilytica TaxID=1544741 RepID=A0A917ZX40_9ACTN|nr:hypothetical protein GCM10012280_56620 [Wenjunlia tyrosinilytica]